MKKAISLFTVLLLMTVTLFSCGDDYDDSGIKKDISDLHSRVEKLETWCTTANSQITALQGLVEALQANDYVTGVSPVAVDGKTGYTITFSKSKAITIFNGSDGADGSDGTNGITPVIGVAKDTDGNYYWTVKTGEAEATWLTDADGNKIRTTGDKGADGMIGKDGVAPELSIEKDGDTYYWKVNGEWLLAADGNKVPATGAKGETGATGPGGSNGTPGKDGDSIFKKDGVKVNDNSTVTFTLADGKDTSFTLPCVVGITIFSDYSAIKTVEAKDVTLALTIKDADYAAIKAEIINSIGMSTAIASRAVTQPWTVAIKQQPAFGTDGNIKDQAIITVTPPAGIADTDTDIALLKVTVVDKNGKEYSSTRVVEYGVVKVYFSDANFVAALKEVIPTLEVVDGDIDPTSAVNKPLIEATKELIINSKSITSLQGIEYFTALETLTCSSNPLTSLDLSKNTALKDIHANMTYSIVTLILPETETLETVQCINSKLTALNVSKNTGLKFLLCDNNALTVLDVSKCTLLNTLSCPKNKLTSLDVSMLSSLDLSKLDCGRQKDEQGAESTLELTVTAEQKDKFDSTGANNANVTLKEKSADCVEINGTNWAVGNLVADGPDGAKIGTATDGGLYFQFGSLVGWSATGDLSVAVSPVGCNVTSWSSSWTGDPTMDDAVSGKGDPCRYYLGYPWRLPTKDEYAKLFNNTTTNWTGAIDWSWTASPASATHTDGLTLSASGLCDANDGGLYNIGEGYYWSASPSGGRNGYMLSFGSSSVVISVDSTRANGLPVRCVQSK